MEILIALGVVVFGLIMVAYVFAWLLFIGWCVSALMDLDDSAPRRSKRGKVTRN